MDNNAFEEIVRKTTIIILVVITVVGIACYIFGRLHA